jgi:hypothetical protein
MEMTSRVEQVATAIVCNLRLRGIFVGTKLEVDASVFR